MNDRLRIASEQLAAINTRRVTGISHDGRARLALEQADALIAAAGEQDSGADPGHWHKVAMRQVDEIDALQARLDAAEQDVLALRADLQAKMCDPALHEDCVSVAVYNVVVDQIQRERDTAIADASDLQSKLDASARLARETAGEAMEAVQGDGTIPRLTKEQAVIVSAYTGYLVCDFADMHKAIERKLARPVFTHELGIAEMSDEIRCAFKSDFLALAPVKGGE